MIAGSYEVFVLLDEACDLMMRGEGIPGLTGLDLVACEVIAAELAQGADEVAVLQLPETVAECVDEAARRAAAWDPVGMPAEALRLVLMLSELRRALVKS